MLWKSLAFKGLTVECLRRVLLTPLFGISPKCTYSVHNLSNMFTSTELTKIDCTYINIVMILVLWKMRKDKVKDSSSLVACKNKTFWDFEWPLFQWKEVDSPIIFLFKWLKDACFQIVTFNRDINVLLAPELPMRRKSTKIIYSTLSICDKLR